MVSNIGLLFKIPFWKARRFDGSELWDGSHLMDAAIEYEMRLGVKYKEGEFRIAETLDIERMTARAKVPLSEKCILRSRLSVRKHLTGSLCFLMALFRWMETC